MNTIKQLVPTDVTRILIADDTRLTAEIERNYLLEVGFDTIIAKNIDELKQLISSCHFNLVIIDADFDQGQGLSLIKLIKNNSQNKYTKVVVTSVISETKKIAEKMDADFFIQKPTPRNKLLKQIKKLTSKTSRDNERIKEKILVYLNINNLLVTSESLDISADGIYVKNINTSFNIDTKLIIDIFLPDNKRSISIQGKIIRNTDIGIGIKFLDMNRNAKRALDKFLFTNSIEQKVHYYYL